ncbi:MAG: hypothetical protein ABIZ56_02305, partial [Chthoniobacteraceae bacterium]
KANRGDGAEVVSPRADDPAVALTGAGGAREAWHGWFVTPARNSTRPIYDLLIGTTPLATMGTNISQNPKRGPAARRALCRTGGRTLFSKRIEPSSNNAYGN